MEFLKNIIEKLSAPSTESVGVYISQDSKMEVIVYNKELNQIKKSERIDLKYDNLLRQIDIEEFEASLLFLVNKMEIPANYPFFVSLPNILTSVKTLPSDLEDIEIEIALNSEAEKSYIFKKAEPSSSWNLIFANEQNLTNTYLYSVIQKEQVENIQQIFNRNGLKLHVIDISFASLIRGLAVSGILNKNIEQNEKWGVAIISYNNYIIAKFDGKKLLNIIETPIALKSIDSETLYPTIGSTISEKLGQERLHDLYLVSQAKDFVAEKLASHLKIICNIHTIDNNKFKNKPLFLSPSSISMEPTSPESVGAACWNSAEISINFNFSSDNAQNEVQGFLGNIGIKKTLHLYLFIGIFLSIILTAVGSFTLSKINDFFRAQISKQSTEIKNLKELDAPTPKVFNLNNLIFQDFNRNKELLDSYDAIGATIPEKIHLDSFFIDDELNTIIKGKSYNVEDIKIYFENLQKVAKFKNLKIKFITISSGGEPASGENPEFMKDRGLDLPLPPMPEQEEFLTVQNYYKFVFHDIKKESKSESILNNLPESVRKIFGN